MTNEELKNMLFIIDTLLDDAITDSTRQKVKDKLTEVCQLAMKALEQQPCEDCISRQKALDTLKTSFLGMSFERYKKAKRMFEQLPSVKPQYTDEEIDKAQAVEQAYVDKMVELAVEEAKRPKGKWIEHPHERGLDWEFSMFECSECHEWTDSDYDYCPNCGAEMSGGGEE